MLVRLLTIEDAIEGPRGTALLPAFMDPRAFRASFAPVVELRFSDGRSRQVQAVVAQEQDGLFRGCWAVVLDLPKSELPPGTEVWADLGEAELPRRLFDAASAVAQASPGGQDRLEIIERLDGLVLVVADGAGGTAAGGQAAEAVVAQVASRARLHLEPFDAAAILVDLDQRLSRAKHGGQTTAVVVQVTDSGIVGASVGDSGALLIRSDGTLDLTERQVRKPLLGDGAAVPIRFEVPRLSGTLLLATDGLLKYIAPKAMAEAVQRQKLDEVPPALIQAVRLRNEALHDDVAVIVCRCRGDGAEVGPE